MRAAAADADRYAEALTTAAGLSRTDPEKTYALLYPGNRTLIPFLGPAFFTKFLYFAGAGAPTQPSLILDSRVATALHRAGWTSLGTRGGWPAQTYRRYTALLARWADEYALEQQGSGTDVLERWLFDHGTTRRRAR
ncbi:hypothetical protein NPA35_00670 [Rhodococcus aetherivorans]|nr:MULTISPECIES: hypothetical protein [Rhodococcus]MBC2590391.1 hypothetical protein [Rhodococcus aetherivorans]PND53617.1 hypothetical protein CQZ88_02160 [Rhodococcus sp. ENV425]WKW98893.1 hypothetical protein Q3O43_00695 [Rhodococcus aetherivorans]